MADWHGAARTNYFPVRVPKAFEAWAARASLQPLHDETSGLWGLYSNDPSGGWPGEIWPDGEPEPLAFDLVVELAAHVREGWPVVLMEAGAEKRRCVTGSATAFRVAAGAIDRIDLSLRDIYALAEQRWGVAPTECAS